MFAKLCPVCTSSLALPAQLRVSQLTTESPAAATRIDTALAQPSIDRDSSQLGWRGPVTHPSFHPDNCPLAPTY